MPTRLLSLALTLLALNAFDCSRPREQAAKPDTGNPAPAAARNRLLFCGDVMLCRDVGDRIRATKDPAHPFRKIAPFLSAADLTFVNLESPFADRGPKGEKGLVFRAHPEAIEGLVLAGVDVASTANNHTRDCGEHGILFTLDWLKQHRIAAVGTGATPGEAHAGAVLTRNGVRFGFLAYTFDQSNGNWKDSDPRIAMMDATQMQRDVAALVTKCDAVIVSMHAGTEYRTKPNAAQVDFAHKAIEAGAVLVIGHHPHVVQPMESYRSGVIFYSLGNFVFDQYQRDATQRGEIAEVIFSGPGIVQSRAIPVLIKRDGPELVSGKM